MLHFLSNRHRSRYGVNSQAFAKRFGVSIGDIATQNFFGDFVKPLAFMKTLATFAWDPDTPSGRGSAMQSAAPRSFGRTAAATHLISIMSWAVV